LRLTEIVHDGRSTPTSALDLARCHDRAHRRSESRGHPSELHQERMRCGISASAWLARFNSGTPTSTYGPLARPCIEALPDARRADRVDKTRRWNRDRDRRCGGDDRDERQHQRRVIDDMSRVQCAGERREEQRWDDPCSGTSERDLGTHWSTQRCQKDLHRKEGRGPYARPVANDSGVLIETSRCVTRDVHSRHPRSVRPQGKGSLSSIKRRRKESPKRQGESDPTRSAAGGSSG
jgi:hypothetical protein